MALIGTLSVVQKSFRIRGWEAVGIVNVQAGRPRGGACGGALAVQQLVHASARLSLCSGPTELLPVALLVAPCSAWLG